MFKKFTSGEYFSFAKDGVMLMVATNLAGVFYMLVHSVTGRCLPESEYAVLALLLGLLNLLNTPSGAINVVMARYVAEYEYADAQAVWVTIVKRALKKITLIGLIGLVVWIIVAPMTKRLLHVPSTASLVVLGLIAFITLYVPVTQGVLQGGRRFGWISFTSVLTAVTKLGCVAVAVWFTDLVGVVLAAILVNTVFGIAVNYIPFRNVMRSTPAIAGFDTAPIYRYLWPVLIGQGAMFLLMNLDLILSARFLGPEEFKSYAKAAMLSRCVFMASLPIALAMFPRVVVSSKKGLLVGPLVFTLVVSTFVALVVTLFPGLPMMLMYGIDAPQCLALMKVYVWAILPVAMLQVGVSYLWAQDRQKSVLWLLPVILIYFLSLSFWHRDAYDMVWCLAVAGWLSFFVIGFIIAKATKRSR